MSQPLVAVVGRLATLQGSLPAKESAVRTAHENVVKAKLELDHIDSDEDVEKAIKAQKRAVQAVETAKKKLVAKTRELEQLRERVRRRIDFAGKENAYKVAREAADGVQRDIAATTRELEALSRAGSRNGLVANRRAADAPAESDLTQAELYAIFAQPPAPRA
ncbi:hypothetical protein AURDEDRAFT_165447 [Auricularia subglabra TFB-10046 SS5]|nr:hypothetical protein AURDEDRAFT_165447 [Auricularia subglabra TFB-10046 SS5]